MRSKVSCKTPMWFLDGPVSTGQQAPCKPNDNKGQRNSVYAGTTTCRLDSKWRPPPSTGCECTCCVLHWPTSLISSISTARNGPGRTAQIA